MRRWLGRVTDRVAGRSVSPDLAKAIVQWSQASAAMARLVGTGSVISAEDRSVILVGLRCLRDLPSSGALVDAELLEAADALESRLMGDELALVSADQEVF